MTRLHDAQHPHHALHEDVLAWYARAARDLPWRAPATTPWGVLVSEVMAQQTPVSRVAPAWRQWLQRWPAPADLATASPAEAIRAWGRLGYPRRALRLREAAGVIVERHGGEVPSEIAELTALPGVGDYTAAAVAVFAYQRRHPVVDVNVRRVLSRAVAGEPEPAPSLSAAERRLAEQVLPQDPSVAPTWSVAVMELGALVCTARNPRCGQCPIRDCAWQRAGAPAHTGPRRRTQAFEGTDRQARGRLMAMLRDTDSAVPAIDLAAAWPDPVQRARALHSLLQDGLVELVDTDLFALPRQVG